VSPEYDGHINLQSLARRIARAIVHFMTVICLTATLSRHINLPAVLVKFHCYLLGPCGATPSRGDHTRCMDSRAYDPLNVTT